MILHQAKMSSRDNSLLEMRPHWKKCVLI